MADGVSVRIRHLTIDCREPYALAQFWSTVTGWPISDEDEPDSPEVALEPPDPILPELLFVTVAERKSAKNRLHLDLVPIARTRDEEVDWLLAAGATGDAVWLPAGPVPSLLWTPTRARSGAGHALSGADAG